jgi:hypothetical protein
VHKSSFIILLSVVALIAAFVVFNKTTPTTPSLSTISETAKPQINMNDKLYLLAKSDDPEKTAKLYNLNIKNGQVQVQLEVSDTNFHLDQQIGIEGSRADNKIDAWVKIDRLIELSQLPLVKNIEIPTQAMPLKYK